MRNFIYCVVGISLFFMMSCGGATVFNKPGIAKVQTVAVMMYSVPEHIEYKDDPKEKSGGMSVAAVVKAAAKEVSKGDGGQAATTSLKSFIETINMQGLPFKVIAFDEMMSNAEFKALYIPRVKKEKSEGMADMAMSMFGAGPVDMGTGPNEINAFGLKEGWGDGIALTGSEEELTYIKNAIKALNVDAALIINDFGYSFSCKLCVGAGGLMSGNASTGSAFHASLVDRDGVTLANIRQWFGSTDGGAAMVSSMVNPLQHNKLFMRHGEKTAMLYAEEFQAALTEVEE